MNEVEGARFRVEELPPGRSAVMFTTDWCGYCRRFYPHFKRIRDGWLVDISDEEDPLWDALAIEVVPTVLVFEGGRIVRRWQGALRDAHVDEVEAALRV